MGRLGEFIFYTKDVRTGGLGTPLADGLRTNCTGKLNLPIIRQYVDDIVTVSEEEIVAAMRELWEKLHLVIEPSAAVPYAAILGNKFAFAGKSAGLILTGGNVDLEKVPWLKS